MTQLIKESWTSYPNCFFQACRFSPINKLKYKENMYKCYYCGIKESSLQSIIEHCKLSHGEETLKYRQLVLEENTGIYKDIKQKYTKE